MSIVYFLCWLVFHVLLASHLQIHYQMLQVHSILFSETPPTWTVRLAVRIQSRPREFRYNSHIKALINISYRLENSFLMLRFTEAMQCYLLSLPPSGLQTAHLKSYLWELFVYFVGSLHQKTISCDGGGGEFKYIGTDTDGDGIKFKYSCGSTLIISCSLRWPFS